ncbi:hypothetical protein PR048_027170 [Dryococelus australis]|uniref:Uncharacterized protein n=1 Tax=Dryococelus australis TaxID=614101 RepID=A0ABQ9GGJ2_9NEOP|nr:hypothetical protein PR048_027170 [Dryococelus australis]
MGDSTGKKMGNPDFNPDKCNYAYQVVVYCQHWCCVVVKELSQRCVGGQELQQQRMKIQSLADETNSALKKNVYQNYMQFIETAKEISRILLPLLTG